MACSILFSSAAPRPASAGTEHVGMLTQVDGEVKLLTQPSPRLHKDASGGAPRVLFEKEYYLLVDAKPGTRVEKGNILRTAPGAKAKIVYENGDQFTVGPGTSFKITWERPGAAGSTQMDLAHGKIRGVIEKGGPRSKLVIKTKTATMGVRGTDFFIADGGSDGGTEVAIIRGAVELKSEKIPDSKPIEVKSGFSASIPAAAAAQPPSGEAAAPAPVVELRRTTQEELIGIQKTTVIRKDALAQASSTQAQPEVLKQIERLEKKAVETTLKDIKTHDPALYARIQTQAQSAPIQSAEEINSQAVQTLIKEAPKAPEKRKPNQIEIEDGAYEKYYKIQE